MNTLSTREAKLNSVMQTNTITKTSLAQSESKENIKETSESEDAEQLDMYSVDAFDGCSNTAVAREIPVRGGKIDEPMSFDEFRGRRDNIFAP